MRHHVGMLLFPGFQILDATGPLSVFETATELTEAQPGGNRGYEVQLYSCAGGPVTSSAGARLHTEPLDQVRRLDTLLLPGGAGTRDPTLDPQLLTFLRQQAPLTTRVASVCTGAFLLAEAGLLNGRRATTHWRHCAHLARRYPAVHVTPDRIWINDGHYWTSAGVTAGIDLALALVADDLGSETARACAREILVYYQRPGGQSQFSTLEEMTGSRGRFSPLLAWIRAHLTEPLRVEDLAARTAMSPRNFARRFRAEVGCPPAQAVMQLRLEAARALVESGREPMEVIARRTGFGDSETMRRAFVKVLGQPPRAWRTAAKPFD